MSLFDQSIAKGDLGFWTLIKRRRREESLTTWEILKKAFLLYYKLVKMEEHGYTIYGVKEGTLGLPIKVTIK